MKNYDYKLMEMRKQSACYALNKLARFGYIDLEEMETEDGFLNAYEVAIDTAAFHGVFDSMGEAEEMEDEIRSFIWGELGRLAKVKESGGFVQSVTEWF